MKKILKIVGIVVAVILLALLIVPSLFKDKVKDVVLGCAKNMVNAELYMGDFSLGFFSNFPNATLSIEDFGVVGVEAFKGDTLANVGELNVVINLASLFKDAYEINKIELVNASANAKVNADSLANWDIMISDTTAVVEEETDSTSSPLNLDLDVVRIKNLSVSYESIPDSMCASVDGIDLDLKGDVALDLATLINIDALSLKIKELSYSDNSTSNLSAKLKNVDVKFSGKVSDKITKVSLLLGVDSTTVGMGGIPYLSKAKVSADVKLNADLENNKFTFGENNVKLNEIQANFKGFVQMVDSTTTDMDLEINTPSIDFKQILSLIPAVYENDFASIQTEGTVALNAKAKGRLMGDTLPTISAELDIANAMFKYPDLPGSITNINVIAAVSNPGGATDLTEIAVPRFDFTMMGTPFSISLGLKTPISDPDFGVTANGTLNLGNVSKVLKLKDLDLKGVLNAALKAQGKMSYVDQEKYELFNIDGKLGLSGFVLKTKALNYDVNVNKADLNFTSQHVGLDADLALGESDIQLEGKLQHFIQFAMRGETITGALNVKSKKLNVNQLLGTTDDEASSSKGGESAPVSETNGASSESSSVAVPKNIDFDLNVSVDKILYDAINLDEVLASVSVKDGIADIKNLKANTMGGSLNVNGEYNTKDTLNPFIDVDLAVNEMEIGQVFTLVETAKKMAPIMSEAEGNFTMTMHLASKMDATLSPVMNSINAKGVFKTKDITIKNVKAFSALTEKTGMDLFKKPNLKNLNLSFVIKDGRLNIDPFETFISNTKLNVSGSSGLDETLDYVAKIQLPENVSKVVDLIFDMNIGGTFSHPKITFGASSIKEQLTEKVSEVVDKAKEKAIAFAKEQKEKSVANAQAQKEKLVTSAQETADKMVEKAKEQRDNSVAKAKNALAKAAAEKAGDAMVKKAQQDADKMVKNAEDTGNKLISTAEKQGDAMIENASKGVPTGK